MHTILVIAILMQFTACIICTWAKFFWVFFLIELFYSQDGCTALMRAAEIGHYRIAEFLVVQMDAKVDPQDNVRWCIQDTPIRQKCLYNGCKVLHSFLQLVLQWHNIMTIILEYNLLRYTDNVLQLTIHAQGAELVTNTPYNSMFCYHRLVRQLWLKEPSSTQQTLWSCWSTTQQT